MRLNTECESPSPFRLRLRKFFLAISLGIALLATSLPAAAQSKSPAHHDRDHDRDDKIPTMWINHLVFLPGDPSVTTSFNAVSPGVGGGLRASSSLRRRLATRHRAEATRWDR